MSCPYVALPPERVGVPGPAPSCLAPPPDAWPRPRCLAPPPDAWPRLLLCSPKSAQSPSHLASPMPVPGLRNLLEPPLPIANFASRQHCASPPAGAFCQCLARCPPQPGQSGLLHHVSASSSPCPVPSLLSAPPGLPLTRALEILAGSQWALPVPPPHLNSVSPCAWGLSLVSTLSACPLLNRAGR